MTVKVNQEAVQFAKKLINDGKYKTDTDWSEREPSTDAENKYLDRNGWDDFGKWYLAIDTSDSKETKERHKFPYGDFKQVHRQGVIAAKQRAAQNHYDAVEKAADSLLELIDKKEGNS